MPNRTDDGGVLVRRADWTGLVILLGFGLIVAALGAYLFLAAPAPPPLGGAALLGGGLAVAAVGAGWRLIGLRRRVWVSVGDGTFTVRDSGGEAEYADADVMSMAVERRKNYANGEFKSVTRALTLWAAPAREGIAAPPPMTMVNLLKIGDIDPLGTLLSRLNDRLMEQARGDLAAGYAVPGDGWTLDGELLSVTAPKASACELARRDIAAVDVVDDRVSVWTKGRDDAATAIPLRSANAYLLLQLLGEELQARRATAGADGEPDPGGGLGRIIFERKPGSSMAVFAVLAALLAVATPALVAAGLGQARPADATGYYAGAAGCALGAAVCALGAYSCRIALFRCHELGVRQRGLTGDRRLRFDEIDSFRYSATRHFHNGVYTGTNFNISFVPAPGSVAKRIDYNPTLKNADDELDQLRDHVSRVLANRMLLALRAGQTVPWTANLAFAPGGIEYRPSGWVGRKKESQLLAYSEFERFDMQAGVLYLYERGAKKAVVSEQVRAANFFPGFLLLTMMTEGAGEGG